MDSSSLGSSLAKGMVYLRRWCSCRLPLDLSLVTSLCCSPVIVPVPSTLVLALSLLASALLVRV